MTKNIVQNSIQGESSTKRSPFLLSLFQVLLTIFAVAFFLKLFVLDFYYVKSDSMEPQLKPGDLILVSRLHYFFGLADILPFTNHGLINAKVWYKEPKVNDIIVFEDNYNDLPRNQYLLKRIEAKPGDEVFLSEDNTYFEIPQKGTKIEINSTNLPMLMRSISKLSVEEQIAIADNELEYEIKEDLYFVLGDNWHNSMDSRDFGLIEKNDIIGSPILIIKSIDKTRNFKRIY